MVEQVRTFTNFADVAEWVETHGIWRLRIATERRAFDEGSAYLAQAWLDRFDEMLELALAQGVVQPVRASLAFPGA